MTEPPKKAAPDFGATLGSETGSGVSKVTGPNRVVAVTEEGGGAIVNASSGEYVSATTLTKISEPNPAVGGRVGLDADSSFTPPPSNADVHVGRTIDGRYLVERVIGEGGMGVVYAARHKIIDKRVAIKVLRGDFARDKEITDRFLQEAKAASSIGNPHIVDISDFGTLPDGSAYFVMEHLDGQALTDIMHNDRPVPVPRLLHLAKQIATGLEAAHQAGIVHRDLKPDNVIVVRRGADKDFAKILDFGIAKVQKEATARITRAGSVFGTPHYMSPEQAAGAPVDQRTDIYALGVILYELGAGKVPFDADNFMGILTQHMYKAPVPMLALVPAPSIPPGLDAIVLKCLSKKQDARYTTMAELLEDLELLEKGGVPKAVGDMMARSGGFSVPVDYFSSSRKSSMPTPLPGTPKRAEASTSWMTIGIGLGVVLLVAGIAAIALKKPKTPDTIGPVATTSPTVTAPPSATVVQPPPSATVVEAQTKMVLIGTDPVDAHVTKDGTDLGPSPVALEVPIDGKISIVVARSGFASQTLDVDTTQPRRLVKLAPNVKQAGGGHHPTTNGTKPPDNMDGFSDPFLKH
ncbi:MAG TPA: serine/threonine-protein kinase [Polyangiaceae bacterium]